MIVRIRATLVAGTCALSLVAVLAPSAHASLLSLLPGSCGNQPMSQPFAAWHDLSEYTPVAGGSFEAGSVPWLLTNGAKPMAGNETYQVAGPGSQSLSLPTGSSALSPLSCTSIYHPTARFFVRNTGSPDSRLKVQAVYPGLLGGVVTTTLGEITGTSTWEPSPAMPLLVCNLLATLSLNRTVIAFKFEPADGTGAWSIDDVYLDPYARG